MAVTTTVWIGWGVACAITFASDVVAGEFTYHILITMMVMTVGLIKAVLTVCMLVGIGHRQMCMNPEGRR
jgi:hypothetical protein